MKRIYLDYAATTPVDPLVLEAMRPHFLENYGNASSVHESGRRAKVVLEESRETLAGLIAAPYDSIVFTSGGTESDNVAVRGAAMALRAKGRDHVVVSAIEHHAVLHLADSLRKDGFRVDHIRVQDNGIIDVEHLRSLVSDRTSVVSVMHVNNETGAIQPVAEAAEAAHRAGAVFHTDAVQSFGKIPVNTDRIGADLLSVSAHKIYGPKGIGALFIRKGVQVHPLLVGGGQERNRRAGTENVPLAAGFAAAARLADEVREGESKRQGELKSGLFAQLREKFPGIVLNGEFASSVPSILNVSFDSAPGLDGEALIMGMDLRGISVTSGAACTSGALEPSHVLLAMGRPEAAAKATIRFSFGRPTTREEINGAVTALEDVVQRMVPNQ